VIGMFERWMGKEAFRAGISSPYYVPGGSFGSLPLGSKIGPP